MEGPNHPQFDYQPKRKPTAEKKPAAFTTWDMDRKKNRGKEKRIDEIKKEIEDLPSENLKYPDS